MSQNHYAREYEDIKNNKNLPPVVKNRLIEDMEALMLSPNPDGFAVEFKCTDGIDLAASDTKHDFKNIDMDIIKQILPSCKLSEGRDSSVIKASDETEELKKILNYVMGDDKIPDDSTRNILLSGGDLPESSGIWSHTPGENTNENIDKPIEGENYRAFDLGNLGWNNTMSRIIKTIKGKTDNDREPILETIIKDNAKEINKVFIIDDIHSTSFIEDIRSQKDKGTDPFWCVLQLAQTIYDPAGKITPKTKPSIFNSPNIEFGWQDIRKEKTSGPITTSVLATETLNLLALRSNQEIITDNITKLMLKNNAYLTISGNPLDYLSHKVSFMYKISDGEDKYAIFDNRSSAIKNRNYISTIIKDAMIRLGIKKKMSTKDGIKSHYIAKRIGDQGQANVCAEETISYIIKKNNTFEARKTNGAHMFVSKDRLAVGSALLFNAPLILHLKAGKPKKDLHHILYIRNDLIEIETLETINEKIKAINKQVNELNTLDESDKATDKLPSKKLEEYINNFTGLINNSELDIINYIKSIEIMIVRFTRCKILLDVLSKDIPEITNITQLEQNATVTEIESKKNEMKELTIKLKNKREIILAVNNKDLAITMSVDTSKYNGRLNRRASTPRTLSELRSLWSILYDKIQTHDTENITLSDTFTRQCIEKSDLPNKNEKIENYMRILSGESAEILLQQGGNAPSYGFSSTETIEQNPSVVDSSERSSIKPIDQKPTMVDFSGRVGGSPYNLIINWLSRKRKPIPEKNWLKDVMERRDKTTHQIQDDGLFMLLFVRNALAIIYDIPELIYTNLYHIPELNNLLLNAYKNMDDDEESGYAPSTVLFGPEGVGVYGSRNILMNLFIREIDIGDMENDFHTEIDYYHRSYASDKTDTTNQFVSTVIDVLWNAMLIRKSIEKFQDDSVVEGEGIAGLTEKESGLLRRIIDYTSPPSDSDYINEDDDDMEPLLQINRYAREHIDRFIGQEIFNNDEMTIQPTQSIRIIYARDGKMKHSCGFFRNCIQPVMEKININELFKGDY